MAEWDQEPSRSQRQYEDRRVRAQSLLSVNSNWAELVSARPTFFPQFFVLSRVTRTIDRNQSRLADFTIVNRKNSIHY